MKKHLQIMTIALSFILLVSCATGSGDSGKQARDLDLLYPADKYVCAVGYGETEVQADNDARLQLASSFGMSIKSSVSTALREEMSVTGMDDASSFSKYFSSESSISVNISDLYGVMIADRYESDGGYVSVAVMERRTTADYYNSKLEQTFERIRNEEIRAEGKQGTLEGVETAAEVIRLLDEYNYQVAVCNCLANRNIGFINMSSAYELYKQAVDAVVFDLEVTGDDSGAVESAIGIVLTGLGFSISKESTSPAARATANVVWRESAGTGAASAFTFANFNADISIVDLNGDGSVMVFSAKGKEGHQNYENARSRAVNKLAEQILNEFGEEFRQKYGY